MPTEAGGGARGGPLVPNDAIDEPPAMIVLLRGPLAVDPVALERALRAYDDELADARVETDPDATRGATWVALVGFGAHVVRLVGIDKPLPRQALEPCLDGAPYAAERKAEARAHRAHLVLRYVGRADAPLEQHVALAAVAGALVPQGALAVVNEAAMTSVPASFLARHEDSQMVTMLRGLPPAALYMGFTTLEVEGVAGIWMRTHGGSRLGVPDLALHAEPHDSGEAIFDLFNNVLWYLLDSGARLEPGHTMELDTETCFRFRAPAEDEGWLEGPDELLVVELIDPSEIER